MSVVVDILSSGKVNLIKDGEVHSTFCSLVQRENISAAADTAEELWPEDENVEFRVDGVLDE